MDRQEWLKWRKIGSSDAPAIMGVSPWTTPHQLWEQKVFGKENEVNSSMRRGIEMEETARRCFEKKMGVEVFAKRVEHPSINFMTATLDGIDIDNKVLVEIKCPNRDDQEQALSGKVPEKYIPQLQHQLCVTGLDGMYYFSFDGVDGCIVEVPTDAAYIQQMIEEEERFWECIQNHKAPALTDRDYVQMGSDNEWHTISAQWLQVSKNLKSLEKEEDELRKSLIGLAQNRNAEGAGVKLTRFPTQGAVDYSKIPELQGINTDVYRKEPYMKWRLSELKN
jgi:putative phage-type endonuclease